MSTKSLVICVIGLAMAASASTELPASLSTLPNSLQGLPENDQTDPPEASTEDPSLSTLPDSLQALPENDQTDPPEASTEDPDYSTSSPSYISEAPLKKKCEKNGGPGTYDKCNDGTRHMPCLSEYKRLKTARFDGQLHEVIGGYCNNKTHYMVCLNNLTEIAQSWFNSTEQTNMKALYNIIGKLFDFVCLGGRESFTSFIAEGGIECIMQQQEELQACFSTTFNTSISRKKQCKQYKDSEKCVLKKINSCEKLNTTFTKVNKTITEKGNLTATFVESLFQLALEEKASPCHKSVVVQGQATTVIIVLTLVILIVVVGLATVYFTRFYRTRSQSYPAGSAHFNSCQNVSNCTIPHTR